MGGKKIRIARFARDPQGVLNKEKALPSARRRMATGFFVSIPRSGKPGSV
jgi:hypothetical protein